MFSLIRVEREGLFAGIAMVLAFAISLTTAPAASAQSAPAPLVSTDTVLHSFGINSTDQCDKIDDGADPQGSLTYVAATGLLFGRTSSTTSKGNLDGTIFQILPNGTGYTVDHFFTGKNHDGIDPRHNAMTLVGTTLYGTTLAGGGNGNGTIFSINDDGTGSVPPLFEFPATGKHNAGTQPYSCFVADSSGVLFGMTSQGGNSGPPGDGTIFAFEPTRSRYARLHTFDGKNGSDPHGQLILDPDGVTFYGMTRSGGKHKVGIIFSIAIPNCPGFVGCKSTFKVLHNFSCPGNRTPMCTDKNDGATPDHGTLVQSGSTLYGLTTYGGRHGAGAIFSIDTDGKNFTILHSFGPLTSDDGINPFGSLTLNDTTLYGTTQTGGTKNKGTVFQINTDGTGYSRVYDFQNGNDGMNPIDDVLLLNNTLYLMTETGGQCSEGAIVSIALP